MSKSQSPQAGATPAPDADRLRADRSPVDALEHRLREVEVERDRLREALEKSEHRQHELIESFRADRERYESLLEHLPVGVWIVDQDGRVVGKNAYADRIWVGDAPLPASMADYTRYEARFADGTELAPEDYPVARALLSGEPVGPTELRIRRFDGSDGTVLVSAVPIRNREGALTGVVGINVDISERVRTEAALMESQARQAFLLRLNDRLRPLSDPAVIRYEAARMLGEYLGASRVGYGDDLGDRETISVTCNFTNGVPGIEGQYRYGDFGSEVLGELRAGRTVVRNDIAVDPTLTDLEKAEHAELQVGSAVVVPLAKGGRLVAVLFLHQAQAREWTQADIALTEAVAERTWDAMERARAEDRVRRNEETFRHLVQNSPFGVYVVDSDFRLQLISEGSRKVFRTVRPLIGRDFAEVLRAIWAEPFASEAIARFRHTLETGEPYHAPDTTELRQDIEKTESYDWKIERITLPDGRHGVVCHFYDLTQRQQFEAALQESRQRAEEASLAKSQFLAVMSHELRTPLTGVIGFADLLESDVLGPTSARQQEALSRIKASSWHLISIIDEILTLSRVEVGREKVRWEEVDVAEITREVVRILEHQVDAGDLALRLDGADAPALVRTDAGKVRQILINLVGNALKFTTAGAVEVRLDRSEPGCLCLHVRDTGPGIHPDDQERVFEVFTQLDSSHTRGKAGTGLGLAICRRLAELLGGEISLQSTPGEGSTFTLRLPLEGPAA